jgi:hypothetical protein
MDSNEKLPPQNKPISSGLRRKTHDPCSGVMAIFLLRYLRIPIIGKLYLTIYR